MVSAVLDDLREQQTDFSTSIPLSWIAEDLTTTFPMQNALYMQYMQYMYMQYNITSAELFL